MVGRREFIKQLAVSVSERGHSVSYPDHPLLMRGPDVLAQVDDQLVAYFVFMGSGPKPRSDVEQARLLLSRFALPLRTCFIMVVPTRGIELQEADVALVDGVQYGLGRGRGPTHDAELGDSFAASIVNELRPFHLLRYSDAWAARPRLNAQSPLPERPGIPTSKLARKRQRRHTPPWAAIDNGVLYAGLEDVPSRVGLNPAVMRLVTTAVDMDYSVTQRSLTDTAHALAAGDAHLAVHHATFPPILLGRSADPYKLLRAAAFSGIRTENMERD